MTKIKLTSKREKAGAFLRKTFLTLVAMLLAIPAFAQNIDVSGTVVDKDGEPLIGATVMLAGTSVGTATDLDGNYTLKNVDPKARIIFSYIGYNSLEEKIDGRTTINAVLTDNAELLEEVVLIWLSGTCLDNAITRE